MSEMRNSALSQAEFKGLVTVREAGLHGMITLRGDLDALAGPVRQVTGLDIPATRKLVQSGDMALGWMSPDELLLMLPHDQAAATSAALQAALAEVFATVANVSDARAVFTLSGTKAADVLAKLCPVDFRTLHPGDIRRTRAAQVAAAIWVSAADEMTVVCFRSVATYMFDLLSTAARPGSDPALYS